MNTSVPDQGVQHCILRVQRSFRWAIAAVALLNCWMTRFIMNPDGVSYLDMGDAYWRGNWHVALNAYWSPLYSWLTGLMFRVTKPTIRWEYPEVHLLTFAILIVTLFCFEFFWRELLTWRDDKTRGGKSEPYLWALGYLLFAYVHFVFHPLELVTPDLLVAAVVYLISGMMLRFATGQMGPYSAGLFGVLLGMGYLAKAAVFPFSIVVLTTMFAVALRRRTGKLLVGIALLGFIVISAPYIAALSWNNHRLTFGDSGKLNIAWYVNDLPQFYWQGNAATNIYPQHSPRKLHSRPDVYEFSTPIAGTFPVWYDPTYWNAGIDTHLHPKREVVVFTQNLDHYVGDVFLMTGFLTAVLLLIFLLSDRMKESCRKLLGFWPILVPAIAVVLMYAMVLLEARYYSGVTLVAWGAIVASTSIATEEWRTKAFRGASMALGVMLVFTTLWTLSKCHLKNAQTSIQIAVAEDLRSMGMKPGDQVAVIGNGLHEMYWARLERVKIVGEVPEEFETGNSAAAFWSSGPQDEQLMLNLLKTTGAKAVIADSPPTSMPPGWVPVGNTGHAIYFF